MNSGALFVIEKISFQWNITLLQIFLSVLITAIFCIIIFYRKKFFVKNVFNKNNISLPQIEEKNFNKQMLLLFQKGISEKYAPKNSHAHTFSDIKKYCQKEEILEIYEKIEYSIFMKKPLTHEEKNTCIQIFTKNFLHD